MDALARDEQNKNNEKDTPNTKQCKDPKKQIDNKRAGQRQNQD